MRAPRCGVYWRSRCAGTNGRTGDTSLILALVGEQGAVIDVACRIKPAVIDGPCSAGVVDVEPAARRQSHCLQADVVGERCPAGSEKYFADLQFGSVIQFEDHLPAVRPAQRAHRYTHAHIDPCVDEPAGDQFAHKGLHAGQQP